MTLQKRVACFVSVMLALASALLNVCAITCVSAMTQAPARQALAPAAGSECEMHGRMDGAADASASMSADIRAAGIDLIDDSREAPSAPSVHASAGSLDATRPASYLPGSSLPGSPLPGSTEDCGHQHDLTLTLTSSSSTTLEASAAALQAFAVSLDAPPLIVSTSAAPAAFSPPIRAVSASRSFASRPSASLRL